ncbi:6-bladed beta-propeller, partial [candidate division KSB1 bacterium]
MKRILVAAWCIWIIACSVYSQDADSGNSISDITIDYVRTYGGLETEDDNLILFYPISVLMDKLKNLYILENGSSRIQIYDPNGKYLSTIGREGQGPAEFQSPCAFTLDKNGNIHVMNAGSKFINVINKNYKELRRTRSIKIIFQEFEDSNIELDSNGNYITCFRKWNTGSPVFERTTGKEEYYIDHIVRFDKEGKLIDEFSVEPREKNYTHEFLIEKGNDV